MNGALIKWWKFQVDKSVRHHCWYIENQCGTRRIIKYLSEANFAIMYSMWKTLKMSAACNWSKSERFLFSTDQVFVCPLYIRHSVARKSIINIKKTNYIGSVIKINLLHKKINPKFFKTYLFPSKKKKKCLYVQRKTKIVFFGKKRTYFIFLESVSVFSN